MHSRNAIALATVGLALASSGCKGSENDTPGGSAKQFGSLMAYDWEIDAGVETYFCGYETLTEDLWVRDFRPVMPTGTHHVVLGYQDPAVPDGYVPVQEGALVSPSTCTGFTFGDFLAFGAGVGTEELSLPTGVAVKVPAGKQLVFGLHLLNTSSTPLSGHSGIEVVQVGPSEAVQEAEIIAAGKYFDLSVPPGTSTQIGTCEMVSDVSIFAVMPHMHLAGTHMTMTAGAPDGGTTTLFDDDYLFTDQHYTILNAPLPLMKGDELRVECDYENGRADTLTFGESTDKNEMCLAFAYRYPAVALNAPPAPGGLGRGSCYAGSTPPVTCGVDCSTGRAVLAPATYPVTLAVDANDVYWTNTVDHTVMKVPTAGGTPTVVASGQSGGEIKLDATNLYWVNGTDGTVMMMPKAGGAPTTLATGQSNPAAIGIDDTNVYWINQGPEKAVMTIPIGGGSPTTLASGQDGPDPVTADATSVYWTNDSGGTVMTVSKLGGSAPIPIATGQAGPQGLAVDATGIYWINHGNGTVMKAPLGGGTLTKLATGQPLPAWHGIAIDGTSVYWLDTAAGAVMKVPKAGGAEAAAITSEHGSGSVGVDATSVYWFDAPGFGYSALTKFTPK